MAQTSTKNIETLQLIEMESQFLSTEQEEGVFIKGFASVEMIDRDSEIVSPMAFNIDTFLNTGTLLVNHKFHTDDQGNQVAAGVVEKLNAAYIANFIEEDGVEMAVVHDIVTNEFVNTIPAKSVPELGVGDRGLFAVARVTEPSLQEKVLNGEFGAFSWQGLVDKVGEIVEGKIVERLTTVDLFELSMVNMPAVNQASFVIGKSLGFSDSDSEMYVYQVLVPKSCFGTPELAKSYLKQHELSFAHLREDDNFFVAPQPISYDLDFTKSVKVRLGEITVVMAAIKSESSETRDLDIVETVSEPVESEKIQSKPVTIKGYEMKLYTFDEASLARVFGNYNTRSKSVTIGDTEVEIVEVLAGEELETDVDAEPSDDIQSLLGEQFDALRTEMSEKESESITALQTELEALRGELAEMKAASEASKETSEEDAAKTLDSLTEVLGSVLEQQKSNDEAIKSVINSVMTLAKATPQRPDRAEKSVANDESSDDVSDKRQAFFSGLFN